MKRAILSLFFFLPLFAAADFINLNGFWPVVTDVADTSAAPILGNQTIDAAGEKTSLMFYIFGTQTFRRFGFFPASITTGDTLDVRLESAVTGPVTGINPSGNLFCATSSTTLVLAGTDDNTYKETANLPSDCTVTNSTVAIVIHDNLGNFNGNFKLWSNARQDYILTFSSTSSASWSAITGMLEVALVDPNSNFIMIPGLMNVSTVTTTNINSGTNPNTRASYIILPFGHRVVGAYVQARTLAPMTWKLWDTDGATVLESVQVSSATYGTNFRGFVYFSSPHVFRANSPYRISMQADNASVAVSNYSLNWESVQMVNQTVSFGPYIYISTANSPTQESSWTQKLTQRATIYPLIDQIEITPGQNKFNDSTLYDTTIK